MREIPLQMWWFINRTIERFFHNIRRLSTENWQLSTIYEEYLGIGDTCSLHILAVNPFFQDFLNVIQEMIQHFEPVGVSILS
jgi:hypothetical protein